MGLNVIGKAQSCHIDNITPYSQTNTQYCWVSAIQMLRNYHIPTSGLSSACDIFIEASNYYTLGLNNCQVRNPPNTTCTNTAASANIFYPFLNWCTPTPNKNDYMNFASIQNQINKGKPFVVSIGYGNTLDNHFLLGKGYDIFTLLKYGRKHRPEILQKNKFIIVNDPYSSDNFNKRIIELRCLEDDMLSTRTVYTERINLKLNTNLIPISSKKFNKVGYPNALKNKLSENEEINICNDINYYCVNIISYSYLNNGIVIKETTKEIGKLNDTLSTHYQKFDNIWQPMTIYSRNSSYLGMAKLLSGTKKLNNTEVDITLKKGDRELTINDLKIPYNKANFPPLPYEFYEFRFKGIRYFIPISNNIPSINPDEVLTEKDLLNILN